ncbi:MAG: hypothetical protein J5706_09440 [Elusimicrobiales bacterium]|nr:hypothetical protein [Elusimicrobiales bacterium]
MKKFLLAVIIAITIGIPALIAKYAADAGTANDIHAAERVHEHQHEEDLLQNFDENISYEEISDDTDNSSEDDIEILPDSQE